MIALAGLLGLHLLGAALLAFAQRAPFTAALRSTSAVWASLAVLGACALGLPGVGVLITLALAAYALRAHGLDSPALPWRALAVLAVLVLARPWVPTQWDEFVWLAKARFEALGFGAGITAALDPAQQVVPAGYPPLWPSAIGWLCLGRDSLQAQVLAGSLLVLLSAATAAQSVLPLLQQAKVSRWWALVLLAAPLVWVHLRSTYVDLPVGLLGVALLGRLLAPRLTLDAVVLAVVLAGIKDEGVALALSATVGAMSVRRSWQTVLPLLAAVVTALTWRLLVSASGVVVFDHALGTPQLGWLPRFAELLVLDASDVFTWGVFWSVVAGAAVVGVRSPSARPFVAMLAVNVAIMAGVLIAGPERVRVFAENGTLLNRLLLQLWPVGLAVVLFSVGPSERT